MTRPGFNIRLRSKHKARIGKSHKITSDEAKEFLTREFGVKIDIMAKDRSYEFTGRKKTYFGRGSRWCKRCGDYTAVIQKYDLFFVEDVLEK